jgi:two-component system response regulator YesN
MENQLCSITRQIISIQQQRSKGIIERIKKVIHERCSDNITIQSLSEEFYLTPNYISMLFKKENGESFKEYLTRIRMEKAKLLMKDTSLKLYEIAVSAGYTDPDYFTKVFKKYTGATPAEYREKLNA